MAVYEFLTNHRPYGPPANNPKPYIISLIATDIVEAIILPPENPDKVTPLAAPIEGSAKSESM